MSATFGDITGVIIIYDDLLIYGKTMIEQILSDLESGEDGIYSYDFKNIEQDAEVKLRESVASHNYQDYLHEVSKHHSVPVMDREVTLFLSKIPKNAIM